MAITPPSDIVLDVMRAADPARERVAVEKLSQLEGTGRDFAVALAARGAERGATQPPVPVQSQTPRMPENGLGDTRAAGVYRKFEAFVLQVFIESMLPKDAQNVFGKGTAGGIWRSMMAEQMGNEIAKGRGVGIARQLAASQRARGDQGADGTVGSAEPSQG